MKSDFRAEAMAALEGRLRPIFDRLERVGKEEETSEWDASYKLPAKAFPYSCTVEEGLALYNIARANGLRSGYEIATAFGVSSLYLALGLQANGGTLVSVDCYLEETKGSFHYGEAEIRQHVVELRRRMAGGYLPDGLAFARDSAALTGVASSADFRVGVSPDDVPALLKSREVDIALIDGGHYGDQPRKDFEALLPFLGPKCAVFFHDNNGNDSVTRGIQAAERALGAKALVLQTYYRLTLVARGLSEASLAEVMTLPSRPLPPRRSLLGRVRARLRRLFLPE